MSNGELVAYLSIQPYALSSVLFDRKVPALGVIASFGYARPPA